MVDKSRWHRDLSDHRLNAALLPVYALCRFEPSVEEIVDGLVKPIEREKKQIKASSMDGQIINFLWELIEDEDRLWGTHNGHYYFLKEHYVKREDEQEVEVVKGLTTSAIKDGVGFSPKSIRKILDSLRIAPDEAPDKVRIGNRSVRAIWFDPFKFEKQLREFVPGYTPWKLYNHLSIGVPDVPDVPHAYVCSEEFKQLSLSDVEEAGEPVGLNEVEHLEQVEQVKGETVVDLSPEKKVAIIDDAIDFFKRLDKPYADHEVYVAYLQRRHNVGREVIEAVLWNHRLREKNSLESHVLAERCSIKTVLL